VRMDEPVDRQDPAQVPADGVPVGIVPAVAVSGNYLRTRNRRMVTAPARVLLTGSRSILARPGEE
jgi:hypothetical protein